MDPGQSSQRWFHLTSGPSRLWGCVLCEPLSGLWKLRAAGQRPCAPCEHPLLCGGLHQAAYVDIRCLLFSGHPCLLDVTHSGVSFRCPVCGGGTTRFLVPCARYLIKAGTSFTCRWAEAVLFLVKNRPQGGPCFLRPKPVFPAPCSYPRSPWDAEPAVLAG